MKLTAQQLHILQHSLGCDEYGRRRKGSDRNRYVIGPGGDSFDACRLLTDNGLMTDTGPRVGCGGMHLFYVTDKGRKEMFAQSQVPPRLKRSAKRYLEYLDADSGLSFGEWLKTKRRKS